MIGYVKIYKPELKVKDFQIYNAYYCGICKSLGMRYGIIYRNLLNYDSVFLAIAMHSLEDFNCSYEDFRCVLHPVKKKTRCTIGKTIEYVTDITVYLTYKKLSDDVEDDNSLLAKTGVVAFGSAQKKATRELGAITVIISDYLKKLSVLEAAESNSIDETSDCYGNIYSSILCNTLESDSSIHEAVKWFGYNIGRWIYIIDAFDDLEVDLKKTHYNVILNRFPKKDDINLSEYKQSILERMSFIMYSALNEASKAFEIIDKSINSGIIKNILYEGMYSVTEKVLNGDCINATKKSI